MDCHKIKPPDMVVLEAYLNPTRQKFRTEVGHVFAAAKLEPPL